MATPRQIQEEIAKISWYHKIDLGHGIITPGTDDTLGRIAMIGLPDDLKGTSVLDIGAWDGAFSFEAERRGANRVVAVDSFCWSGMGWGTKDGFDCVRRLLGSKVEDREIEVLDLSPDNVGVFDLVLFLGVLYHIKHPLLALERVASVSRSRLILWTQVDLADLDCPAMAYYPGKELNDDPTNWWGPNPLAIEGMLKTVGYVPVGADPMWATFTPDSKKLYVANNAAGSVSVVDTTAMKELTRIEVGQGPRRNHTAMLP